ncbi:hypothetical protein MTO96_007772 [Rhipicephalus appendiculatus]
MPGTYVASAIRDWRRCCAVLEPAEGVPPATRRERIFQSVPSRSCPGERASLFSLLVLLLHGHSYVPPTPPYEWCNHETSSSTPLARARAAVGSARRDLCLITGPRRGQ